MTNIIHHHPDIPEPGDVTVPEYAEVERQVTQARRDQIVATVLREIAMALGRAEIVQYPSDSVHAVIDPFKSRRNLSKYLETRADELDPPDTTGGHDVTVTLGSSEDK